ncbi:hypothetical protein [Bacillus sp. EB600]|uniref:hypothetical protein n=1 Tax=Bacillus sp. EB600 TaxID=2806345 RepID=UPI00210B9D8C|nr:hypothetical protein [Bacillus sp. EB600]MCQ6282777.1 hypothetical protein [Bacillus sp. EB600]
MSKDNKKGWFFLCAVVAGVIIFICFSIYINQSTLVGSLSQTMQNKDTTLVSYQLYSKNKAFGGDSIYSVKAANGKQYHVDVDHNHLVISTVETK